MVTDTAMVLNNSVKIPNARQIGCMIEIYVADGLRVSKSVWVARHLSLTRSITLVRGPDPNLNIIGCGEVAN